VCQHCKAQFEACDPTSGEYPPEGSSIHLLDRAEQLLDSVDAMRNRLPR
jgi:hypothetical protein